VHVQPNIHLFDNKGKGADKIIKSDPIEADVLVTRNPCVHCGDIRKLKAVKKEQLKEYYNVIVFSSKGKRPQQDKMA